MPWWRQQGRGTHVQGAGRFNIQQTWLLTIRELAGADFYTRVKPRLIHLNGASRVGKSTLARRYVDERPGTLALDLDVLAGLIGGWRDDLSTALGMARAHGRAMATRHLDDGYDVVIPQLVTSFDRGPGLEEAAQEAGVTYIEVALLVNDDEHLRRIRGKQPTNEVEARIQTRLEDPNSDLVGRIRQHLAAYLVDRPNTIRIDTTGLGADESYARLLDALAETQTAGGS